MRGYARACRIDGRWHLWVEDSAGDIVQDYGQQRGLNLTRAEALLTGGGWKRDGQWVEAGYANWRVPVVKQEAA